MSERLVVKQLPNGELYRVKVQPDHQDKMQQSQERMRQVPTVTGQNRCRYCGGVFTSASILSDHEKMFHAAAAGLEDVRPVLLPDGSVQPAAVVKEAQQKG